jgi:CRISPR-associated protein Csd2
MTTLQNKIDFAVVLSVKNANPNGDPLNGNRPRTDYDGHGEITDVCIKRKIRDRLQEAPYSIFVQSDDKKTDEYKSLKSRAEAVLGNKLGSNETAALACAQWLDVRAFGQLFAFKSTKTKDSKKAKESKTEPAESEDTQGDSGVSIGIRGPVSVQSAFSIAPVDITSTQIIKSVNGEDTKDGKKSSDTMGMKHRVDHGIYAFYGSMNPQLAEKTGFSEEDADAIKQVLPKLFENDVSSARPDGSMEVLKVFWWQHNCKSGQYSSAKVHRSLIVNADGRCTIDPLDKLEPEIIDGF